MADNLEITLDTTGISRAVQELGRVSQAIGMLGMGGGAAGGIGGAVAGVALGAVVEGVSRTLKNFEASIKLATDAMGQLISFSNTQFRLGASTSQTAFLSALGGSLGVSDVAGSAARLHAASLSGLGAMEASRIGIQMRPHEIGTGTNRGEMLIQAMEGLRSTFTNQGFGAAVAMARNLDVEEWLNVVYLMDRQFKQLKQDATEHSGMFSQRSVTTAIQLNHEVTRLSQTFEHAKTAIAMLFLPGLNMFIEMVKSAAAHFARLNPFGGLAKGIFDRIMGGGGGGAGSEQTAAIRENTNELRQLNGTYGGGRRFRSAIPGAFGPGNGWALQAALRSHAVRLGAYSVSL